MRLYNFAFGMLFVSASLSVSAESLLSGEQIKEAFTGKTVSWKHMIKSNTGMTYVAEDGTAIGVENGAKREGTWRVEGDNFCISWGNCQPIESDGNGGYYKLNGSKRVVHLHKLEDGNTL